VSPALQENHLYWWRVRATDSHGLPGPWMSQAVFQVSVQNDPPTAPIPLLPLDGETLTTATPTLQWLDSLDPEGASLTYQVEVYSDKHLTTLVASVSGLPGTLLTTTWQVTPALLDKTTYYWRVRGSDGQLSSAWSGTQSFKVGKLTTRGTLRYFAATRPSGLAGRRVATIGSLGGLTGGETEAIFFYQTDHLGTPIMMTDQTGQVVWQEESLPFGEPVSINEDVDGDGVDVTNNLRFPGQYSDGETGLHYNMARDYQPDIGRYVEADPIGQSSDLNSYVYAKNNALRWTDPYGLESGCYEYKIVSITSLNAKVLKREGDCPFSYLIQKGITSRKGEYINQTISKECHDGPCCNKTPVDEERNLSQTVTQTFWWTYGGDFTFDENEGKPKGMRMCTVTVKVEGRGHVKGWEGTCCSPTTK